MTTRGVPEFAVATRGLVYFHLTVRTGERDLHSGLFGGAALNATHALLQTLAGVQRVDGRLPEPLRAGIAPPTERGARRLGGARAGRADAGRGRRATPVDPKAAEEFYLRTTAEPALDVNGIVGRLADPAEDGAAGLGRGEPLDPARARPGRRGDRGRASSGCCARPPPRAPSSSCNASRPRHAGLVPPDAPAVQLAQDAFEQTMGRRPLLVRSGGTLPIVPALVDKGIPTIVTGFATPESSIHSPNERLLAEYMPLGIETAKELYRRLAALER